MEPANADRSDRRRARCASSDRVATLDDLAIDLSNRHGEPLRAEDRGAGRSGSDTGAAAAWAYSGDSATLGSEWLGATDRPRPRYRRALRWLRSPRGRDG